MKTAKALVGRVFGSLAMLSICAFASTAAFGEMDITAYMRSLGSDAYSVEPYGSTVVYVADDYTPTNAVDGIYGKDRTENKGRVLFNRYVNGNPNPCDLKYSLCTHGGTNYIAKVTSFTLYRLNATPTTDVDRAPKRFALYGSNGDDKWNLLYETAANVEWSETISVTCQIPAERQMMYSQYRLKLDATLATVSHVAFHELILNGEVYASRVWTGNANSNWNSSDANWTGNTNTASLSWGDAQIAVFVSGASSKAVTVDAGGIALGGISVNDAGYSFSGGDLKLVHPAHFDVEYPVAVSSDIVDTTPTATAAQADYLPYTEDKSTGTWVKLWENRQLAATRFVEAYIKTDGFGNGTATAFHPVTNAIDGSVSVQFQYIQEGDDKPLICVKAEFKQVGRDVWGRAVYIGYSWSVRNDGYLGEDFDSDSGKYTHDKLDTRNIKNIVVADSGSSAPLRFILDSPANDDCYAGSCLPRSASDSKTGEEVLCWANRQLCDLDVIESFSFYDGSTRTSTATLHYFENNGETASFQLQYNRATGSDGRTARLGVKVELRQDGSDIRGRVVYARYYWYAAGEEAVTLDFDTVTADWAAAKIRDDINNTRDDGYGAGDLRARFRSRARITGDLASARNIEIYGGTLSLGASSLSLPQEVSGTGTLEFSPESGTQTVSVGADAAPTVCAARFSGMVTLEVAKGGSIAFDSVSFADGAVVNLVVASGASANQSVRVGTTASLTSAELAHFLVDGNPVKYQTEDGWLAAGAAGLVIFVR